MWYFQGSILNDFYTSCCCAECVMCQLSREHDFVTSQAMTYWWQSNTLCILWLWYSADSIMCQYYSNIRPSSFIPDIGNLNALNSSFLFVLFSWINYPWKNLQYQMSFSRWKYCFVSNRFWLPKCKLTYSLWTFSTIINIYLIFRFDTPFHNFKSLIEEK